MRILIPILLILVCHFSGIAQQRPTKEATLQFLRTKLSAEPTQNGKANRHVNYTKMCVDYSLVPENEMTDDIQNSKHFKYKIETKISWKANEMDVENAIYKNGRLIETYVYLVPLNAIVSASLTNCKRNASDNVNAYVDRPVFVKVKKNSTKIGHQRFDKTGHEINPEKRHYQMNSKEVDWDSEIPIAGNWDKEPVVQEKVINAFNRLGELNAGKYARK